MNLTDIINRIASQIVKHTGKFHDILTYSSIVMGDNGLVTVTTDSPHGLHSGDFISVNNMEITHDVISMIQEQDGIATVELADSHDLTENWQQYVTITGADQAGYNGKLELLHVPNRQYFTCAVDKSLPEFATGSIKFHEILEYGYDGAYRVTVIDDFNFTFVIENTNLMLDGFNGTITINQRIWGSITPDRFLEFYERQLTDKYCICVCLDDATFSKDRNISNDATGSAGGNSDIRNALLEPFSVYVVIPSTDDPFCMQAINSIKDEIAPALYQILIGYPFHNDTQQGTHGLGHRPFTYHKAFYVHEFKFETYKELTLDNSVYAGFGSLSPTRAFRDAFLQLQNSYQVKIAQDAINLDDDPLHVDPSVLLQDGSKLKLEQGIDNQLNLE